ncbi:ankyrin repeat-containing protein [Apiospora kogelbergensis]|uniref:ankyrin repeat-containing protein n=1 Tax=Apiospora kogelbergensis TaxID=1337665 RepID=UPI00312D280D
MESQGGDITSAPGIDDFEVVARDAVPSQPLPLRPSIAIRRAAIQKWLQPTDYLSPGNELMKHVHSHVPGTGSWAHEAPAFQAWSGSAAPNCLALKGVAGSGKSVFAASTVRKLQQSEPDVPVLFFFFRQIVEKNHSAKYLVRDLASQLLPWSDILVGKLEELSKSCGVDGSEHGALWDAIVEAIHHMEKVYCVIDALDEMDDEDFDVVSRLCSIGNHDFGARVLLTCRPIPKIDDALRSLSVPQMKLEPSLIYPDVAKYVSVSLATLDTTLSPEKEDLVKQTICERAQGLFLHARLMTDNLTDGLQKGRIAEQTLPDSLERLPRNLREVYDAMLLEHATRSGVTREEQARILMCVTHSTRPLRLIELGSLVARGKALVKASCGRLLEILEDESISVIHHSFTEFLHDDARDTSCSSFPVLDASSAHAMLVELSLQYLDSCQLLDPSLHNLVSLEEPNRRTRWVLGSETASQSDIDGSELVRDGDDDDVDEREDYGSGEPELKQRKYFIGDMALDQPLMRYAIDNLHYHMGKAKDDEKRVFDALDAYLRPGKPAFEIWVMACMTFNSYRDTTGPGNAFSIAHFVAFQGIPQYFLHLSQVDGIQLDEPDRDGRTPLSYAAEHGHVQIVSHLLGKGVNPESADHEGWTPLHHASRAGHYEISKLLLEAGVSPLISTTIPTPYNRHETPLQYACKKGDRKLIDLFLRLVPSSDANKCFHWASGIEAVAAVLEMGDVDVDCFSRGETRLFRAAEHWDSSLVEVLLARGADPNKRCSEQPSRWRDDLDESDETIALTTDAPEGPTPMHALTGFFKKENLYHEEEARKCLTLLLSHGGQINMGAGEDSKTPLHLAVERDSQAYWGEPSLVDMLLGAGADPNARNIRGETPLHGVTPGSPGLVDSFVRHGADIDAVDNNGFTPLLTLMSPYHRRPNIGTVERLIDHGADVNKATNKGNTIMHMIMMNFGEYSTEDIPHLIKLLRTGGDLSKKNHDGLVPLLTFGFEGSNSSSCARPAVAILELFAQHGMDINACDGSGETILWKILGLFDGGISLMKQFIGLGADPRVRRSDGTTLLHAAVKNGCDLDWIRFLISYGMDPATADHEGNPLVHLALETSGRKNPGETMGYVLGLVELGAPSADRNAKGQSVLHLASAACIENFDQERGREHLIDFALNSPAFACTDINERDSEGATSIHCAASCSEFNVARLLNAGADPTLLTNEGMSPLHIACISREAGTVGLLLSEYRKRGVLDQHINLRTANIHQRSPLHYACRSGHLESVRYLLLSGADPSLRDRDGYTPLHALAESSNEERMWKRGEIASRGMTSFQWQIGNYFSPTGQLEMVNLLYEAGSDLEAETERRGGSPVTPMDLAIEMGCQTMAAELTRRGIASRQGVDVQLMHEQDVKKTVQYLASFTDPEDVIQSVETQLKNGNIGALKEFFRVDGNLLAPQRGWKQTSLHMMASKGYAGLLEHFKEKAYQVDYSPWMEEEQNPGTLLAAACACQEPNLHVIQTLVESVGVDVNAVSHLLLNETEKATALHSLALGSHFWQIEALEYLLDHGADISARDTRGQTPLLAALNTRYSNGFWRECTIQILLQRGADPNVVDDRSISCLEQAENSEIARLLFQHGADLSRSSDALACAVNRMDPLLVELLIENGAEVRNLECDEYYKQNTVLQAAARRQHHEGLKGSDCEARQLSVIKSLLRHGADPFLAYRDGTTILQAVIENHGVVGPFFELEGLDMERKGKDERSLLVSACVPNVLGHNGPQAVHWEAAFLALERGADPNASDTTGRTALHWLCTMTEPFDDSHKSLLAALIEAGPSVVHSHDQAGATPMHLALQSLQMSTIYALIEHGAIPTEPDPQGDTALHHCARHMTGRKHIAAPASDLFRLFLGKGVNINARNRHGETPLHAFMVSGWEWRPEARGASVCSEPTVFDGKEGEKREGKVVMHTDAAVLALFRDAQADWRCVDDEGSSLLHVVASCRHERGVRGYELAETFEMLRRDFGLDPRLEDRRLRTPVDVAVARGWHDIVHLFSEGAEDGKSGFIPASDLSW